MPDAFNEISHPISGHLFSHNIFVSILLALLGGEYLLRREVLEYGVPYLEEHGAEFFLDVLGEVLRQIYK